MSLLRSAMSLLLLLAGSGAREGVPAMRMLDEGECGGRLILDLQPNEIRSGQLDPGAVQVLVHTMRRCGVVAVSPGVRPERIAELRVALDDEIMAPIVESRRRVRGAIRRALAANRTLEQIVRGAGGEQLCAEPVLASGAKYKERSPGRIDYMLPWQAPFNRTWLTVNPLVLPIISALLGDVELSAGRGAELKSVHVVYALPHAPEQPWHRDQPILFDGEDWDDDDAAAAQAAERHLLTQQRGGRRAPAHGGKQAQAPIWAPYTPAFALNLFIPLVDTHSVQAGPTEFGLGTHRFRSTAFQSESTLTFNEDAGHFIISDYRTVHRGLPNKLNTSRPMLMLVYGRGWWHDNFNYNAAATTREPGRAGDPSSDAQLSAPEAGVLRRMLEAALLRRETVLERCHATLQLLLANSWKDLGATAPPDSPPPSGAEEL
mmetsp:Transcript_8693/g.27629  ORF Transcript_8693/g.27629 Transcript_8693/m.27629 type:complete len:432 (-) Transcript_8693:57-1352(-)